MESSIKFNIEKRFPDSDTPDVKRGPAAERLMYLIKRDHNFSGEGTHSSNIDPSKAKRVGMDSFFVASVSAKYDGGDGVLYSFDVTLPDDIQSGDVFPIDVLYKKIDIMYNLFTATRPNYPTMGPYLFTRGIYNKDINPYPGDDYLEVSSEYDGYIAIKKEE